MKKGNKLKKNIDLKKEYKISRFIIFILTFVIFNIMFINEDNSWLGASFILALIAFGLSFPSTSVSRKFIQFANKIDSEVLRVLYYVFLPINLLIIAFLVAAFVVTFMAHLFSGDLGLAILLLFLGLTIIMAVILPYIQTIIVLILHKFIK